MSFVFTLIVVTLSWEMKEVEYPEEYDRNASDLIRVHTTHYNALYQQKVALFLIRTTADRLQHAVDIRKTWCDSEVQRVFHVRCLFYYVDSSVDKSLQKDTIMMMNDTHNDIRFISLPNKTENWSTIYHNNVMILSDALTTFPGYQYYAIVDDEDYINVEVLVDYLSSLVPENVVLGKVYEHQPYKNVTDKYYDEMATHKMYYPFTCNSILLYSSDLAHFMGSVYHYIHQPPSSLADTAFGFLVYKYYAITGNPVHFHFPLDFDSFIIHRKTPRYQLDHARAFMKGSYRSLGVKLTH
ncbi:hypothetical protein EIN_018270 [Entamoeba invadens IP1]|uniref:hypothetical protein n=1 Tax=Entamoeba invadens IP1 TaxID=370355 RepID=UPI0002C3F8CD|nr:hypothetical protein EIN_018270 [Entamoeba invadens IP1]ELP90478.1 hypothetical protein EIN_018270 [Entamoeba invadens IP1]|eukprot:XP_004257249.1 hypothetical protein EIN_018270 [Entamoeba invadens IP1]